MKKNILFLLYFCVFSLFISGNLYSQSGWFLLPFLSNSEIRSICFTGLDTGYIGNNSGQIYKTINGGNNWFFLNSLGTNLIYKIYFLNNNTGFILAGGIYKTTNKGNDWFLSNSLSASSITFINQLTGFANIGALVLKTTNTGISWDSIGFIRTSYDYIVYTIFFVDSIQGFAGGNNQLPPAFSNKLIWRTSDGGRDWSIVHSASGCEYLDFSFFNLNTGYAVGGCTAIAKTTDCGLNWID